MATTLEPGPRSIDSATTAYTFLGSLRDRHNWLVEKHRAHKERLKTVTNVVIGNWFVEWPDLSQTAEAPTVANTVELGVAHWMAVGGAVVPSISAPMDPSADRKKERPAARKRERRVRELLEASNVSELLGMWWGDYAGGGSAILGVWCDFSLPKEKRNPYLVRFDPRHAYPIKDSQGNITELHIARKITKGELAAEWPELADVFKKSVEEDVEEWFWYTKDRVQHMIVDVSKEGSKRNRNVVLVDEEWPLGFVPAWEVMRPSFDGQRRGVFDQSIHILRTMHRLMLLTVYSSEQHSFPTVVSFDAVNAEDFGPGANIQLRSAEGRVETIGPSAHFDVKDLIARLGEEAAKQAVYPQQLVGEPGASIVSARGIGASMGALDARLAVAHKQFEIGIGKVCGFLLAFDETFCDTEKQISGDLTDTGKAEPYRPSIHVAGNWTINATYGIGAGSDPANIEVRLAMHLGNGMLSRETGRRQLPFLDDPDAEEVKILRQSMHDAFVQGVLARAGQGDPSLAAKALELLKKDTIDVDTVIGELIEAVLNPEPPPGQAGGQDDPALAAIQGAESLARGGIPGNADQAPDPASMALPPMSQILNQDARMIS